jgi:hypothetical protein
MTLVTGRPVGGPAVRAALAVVLLVVATLAVGSLDPSTDAEFVDRRRDEGVSWGGWALLAALLAAAVTLPFVLRRVRGSRDGAWTALHRRPKPPLVAQLAVLAGTMVLALVAARALGDQAGQPEPPRVADPPPTTEPTSPQALDRDVAVATLVVLLVVAVVGVLLALQLRRSRAAAAAGGERTGKSADPASDLAIESDVIAAGSTALGEPRDARQAILACYAAMEAQLASVGAARRPSDTPEELLERVAGTGGRAPLCGGGAH